MNTKYLFLIAMLATMLLMLSNLAFSQDSDVVWTKNMGVEHGVLRVDFVQQGKSILVGGENYLRNLDAQTGEIKKDYGIGGRLYEVVEDGNSFYVANGFIINKYEIESGQIIDNIAIEMTPEYIYDGGDTNWRFKSSVLSVIKQIPNSNLMLGVWQAESKDPNRALIVTLLVIDKSTKKIIKNFGQGQFGAIIEVSPDGKYFVLGLSEGIVELWNAKTFTKIKTIGNYSVASMGFSPDGTKLLISILGLNNIKLFDINSISLIKSWGFELGPDNGRCEKAIFLNDNYAIISGDFPVFVDHTRIFNIYKTNLVKEFNYRGTDLSINNYSLCIGGSYTVELVKIDPNSVLVLKDKNSDYPIIYPNPTTKKITLKFPENITGNISISIIDLYGRIISKSEEMIEKNTKEIDVSSLPAGINFVRVAGKNGVEVYKFVKE